MDADFFGLRDKVCVVTGGGSGIGRGIALRLSEAGARVAILDLNAEGAEESRALVEAAGGTALAVKTDTSDPASVAAARDAVTARLGPAEVLVNNAALLGSGPLETLSLADWNRVIAVNLTGYFLCAQSFGQAMLARGQGALVHVSSMSAHVPTIGAGSYSASKAGVSMLSNQLAVEWGPRGVRSNAVLPGFVRTPFVARTYADPEKAAARARMVPQGRVAAPDDMARVVLFLASPLSDYVNGAEIDVDGGLHHNLIGALTRSD